MFLKAFTNYTSVEGKPDTSSLTVEYVQVHNIVRLQSQADGWTRVGLVSWSEVYVPVTPDVLARALGVLGDIIAPMSGKLPEY